MSDLNKFPIEDPAQAWNAIAVGGFTEKVQIAAADRLDGWKGVAGVGDRSPYSRTSTDWDHSRTPIKPEIVLEAGNRAISPAGAELLAGVDSLSLLTTSREFVTHPLTTFWATSPATAQAAGMAAAIMARHSDLWPETVRALMVHSAEWTPALLHRFEACKGRKRDCIGNSAGQAPMFLSRTVAHVHILVRGADLSASMSDYLVQRITRSPHITVHPFTEVTALEGENFLRSITWRDRRNGATETHAICSLFVMIGAVPNTDWLADCVSLDSHGFVQTEQDRNGQALSSLFATMTVQGCRTSLFQASQQWSTMLS